MKIIFAVLIGMSAATAGAASLDTPINLAASGFSPSTTSSAPSFQVKARAAGHRAAGHTSKGKGTHPVRHAHK